MRPSQHPQLAGTPATDRAICRTNKTTVSHSTERAIYSRAKRTSRCAVRRQAPRDQLQQSVDDVSHRCGNMELDVTEICTGGTIAFLVACSS